MASRHQFHLRWSNYGQNLATSFLRLFETESLSDVTLFCEGESYRAHRVVLAASSVHFQELFEQCSTAQNLVVILDGTSPANLRALLEFMYKGEVYIEDANLNTFLQTAKRLQVKGLSLSQNDLQNISRDGAEDRQDGKLSSFSTTSGQDTILAQALGPMLIPQQQAQIQQPPTNNKQLNSVQSPPNSFSSPSPSRSPPNIHGPPPGLYDEKIRKKIRMPSPRHSSPNGAVSESMDYGPPHHPPRTSAPPPSPSMNHPRLMMDVDHRDSGRSGIQGGFPQFGSHYSPSLHPPGPSPHQHSQQQVVLTENPNIRKIRSISSENIMPEDLSIKLEVGREEEVAGVMMSGKQRSFSMDLSPSEPLFGGGLGSVPSNSWSLPSPSSGSGQQSLHHPQSSPPNAQTTADGKKLKCPFCERLYGYETNLRAHIRQRHQGIRVPCPFCSRTFTRNNTVRRHVAREHRALLGGVGVRFHPQLGGGEGAPPGFGSPPTGSATSSPSQGSPSTSTSASSSSGTNIGLSGMGNTSGGNMISGGGPLGPLGMNIAGPPHSSSGLPAQTPPPGSSNRPNSGSSGGMGSGKSME